MFDIILQSPEIVYEIFEVETNIYDFIVSAAPLGAFLRTLWWLNADPVYS